MSRRKKLSAQFLPMALLALSLFLPGHGALAVEGETSGAKNVGILIMDGLFITEAVAPFDIYKHAGDKLNVFFVAQSKEPITTYYGARLTPDYTFADAPEIDVLVVPSGGGSRDKDLDNAELIAWVKKTAASADYVTSHCWGAFTLGKAGLLDGKKATTFPGYFDQLHEQNPRAKVITDQRFVMDGNVITSNGGLAAFEASLFVIEKLFGAEEAKRIADGLVFAQENRGYVRDPKISASR